MGKSVEERLAALENRMAVIQDHFWRHMKDRHDELASAERSADYALEKMSDCGLDDHLPTMTDLAGIWDDAPVEEGEKGE